MKPSPARLTAVQRRFLMALEVDCSAGDPPTSLFDDLPPRRLAQWLRSRPFRRRLVRLLRVVRHRREVALCLASARAARRLSAGVEDSASLDANQRRLCVDLIKLARGSAIGRPVTRQAPGAPAALDTPIHPDVSPQQIDELLRQIAPGSD